MSKYSKTLVAAAGASALLAASAAGAALAVGQTDGAAAQQGAQDVQATQADTQVASNRVALDKVEGTFSFTQAEAASNDYLARNFKEGSQYLCGAKATTDEAGEASAQDWVLTVDGDVQSGYSEAVSELAASPAVQAILMGCSCLGNPADGTSAANALVNGISALILVEMANPSADANTVVFTSSDGYQVALPLSYLQSHYCPIVFDVNGSPIADSMGGANQLWLGSTPASYFVRNVSSITVETRDEADVPASPTSDEARAEYAANLPNVGVLLGGEVA